MGVRIYAYAVDLPRLDTFLESSLADLLCRYSREGTDPNERLTFTEDDTCDTFVATPKGLISGTMTDDSRRRHLVFTEQQLQTVPILQRSARDHLSSGSIYQSKRLFQAFSNCTGINFIHRLIDGHRRWWIGSVLQFARKTLPDDNYDELVHLFRKMLRGFNCGYRIPDGDVGFTMDRLQFTPEDDPDLRFGRWSENESSTVVELLSNIMALSPFFTRPPGPIGIAPEDSEWHQWVHNVVAALLCIAELNYNVCNVLTFIG